MSQAHGCRMEIAFSLFIPGVQRAAVFLYLRFMQGNARRKDGVTRIWRQGGTGTTFGLQSDFVSWQAGGMANKKPSKNPAAVALGRLGGLKGGPARTASMRL